MPIETIQIQGGQRLAFSWSAGRAKLNASPVYQALRSSDGLLTTGFTDNAKGMITVTEKVDELLSLHETLLRAFRGDWSEIRDPFSRLIRLIQGTGRVGISSPKNKLYRRAVSSIIRREKLDREAFLYITGRIARQLSAYCVQLEELESALKRELKVSHPLTERTVTHPCKCGNLRLDISSPCGVCGESVARKQSLVLRVDPMLREILQNNVWLELAVARILENKGFEVWVGPTVTGLSGTEHEIDIVARDGTEHLLVLGEVTTGRASLRELADLMLRGVDIPAHGKLLVSLGEGNSNASKYARRHGLAIVSQLREKTAHLEEWVENLRRLHGSLVHD